MSLETQRQSDKVRIQQYQTLLEISEAIASNRDLASLFRNLAQHLRAVVDFDWVSTLLYDPSRDLMRIQMLEPPQPGGLIGHAEMPVDDVPSGRVWKTQEPLIIRDVARENHFPQFNKWALQNGVKSYCALPLTSSGRRLGALGFARVKDAVWSDNDLEFLMQVARQVAVAIDNTINLESARTAEDELKRRLEQLRVLLDVTNSITSHLDLRELFKVISHCLRQVISYDGAGLTIYDPESGMLRVHALESFVAEDAVVAEGVLLPIEGTPGALAFNSRQTVLVTRADLENSPSPLVRSIAAGGVKSGCVAPLISHGRVLGTLDLASSREDAFTKDDAELLSQIASQIAIAVENSLNFESVRSAEQQAARERDRIKLLMAINNAVVSHLELGDLVKTISANLLGILPHEGAGIALYEPEQNLLREYENVAYERFTAFQKGMAIPLEGTPAGLVFTSGQPLLLKRPDPERFHVDLGQRPAEGSRKSACLAPLISHGRKLGILGIGSTQEDRFTEEDLELLTQIADQVAIAVENSINFERAREAERELARNLDHLRLMLRVTNTVVSRLNLQELLDVISATICEEMGCDTAGVGLYDQKSAQLIAFSTQFPPGHPFRDKGISIPLEGTPGGLAFTTGQPVFLDRPDPERFNSHYAKRILEDGYRSGGSIPLIAQGRKLGVLGVASKRENSLSDDDRELLVQVANQVAIAVDNALNFERARAAELEVKRQYDRLRLMLEINNAVVSRLDLRDLIRVTAACLREVLHHDIAGLSLYDPETNQLRAYAYDFPDKQFVIPEGTPVPLKGSLGGKAFTSGQSVFTNRSGSEDAVSDFNKRFTELGVKSGGCVPLIVHGRKLGVLGVASLREDAFPEDQQELLAQVAAQIAIAVDNALNFERARVAEQQAKRQSDRLQLLLNLNNAIASALDPPALFRAVSASLREVFQHDFAVLGLYDERKKELGAYVIDSADGLKLFEEGTVTPIEGTPAELAVTTKRVVIIGPGDAQKFSSEMVRRSVEQGLRSSCTAPLLRHNRVIGVMTIASKREAVFTPDDGELFLQIAGQIAIAVENALAYREIDALKNKLASEKLYLEDEIRTEHNFEELIGASPSFKRILKQIETVAPTDSTVLIRGETGTGKELIARAIHSLSGRNERTLVKINCAAIPTGLLESELFGHEKGAFTGAIAQRVGRFELAHKGTLFLDEVGDIPFELQPKLLRVLQEQEFERLGSARTQKVDVRLIAATNADLEHLVADRKYRSDLYYRLNVFPITIPPLRERAEDIPALTRFFTQKYARRLKKRIEAIPAEVMTAITNYRWPGNVRELEHFIERAVVLTLGSELEVSISELKSSAPAVPVKISTLEDAERGHIIRALDDANWVIGGPNGAAARLGMKRTTLQSKMQKLGISRSK
jgi:formate hydrogenlyase transcriptional activator